MACNSCDQSSGGLTQPGSLTQQIQPQSKPLALGNDPTQYSGSMVGNGSTSLPTTTPGQSLLGGPPQGQPQGSAHDQWLAMPASQRAYMTEPGSSDRAYQDQQEQNSNAMYASQGVSDPWARTSVPMGPSTQANGGGYQVASSQPGTFTPPTTGAGYQPGTQSLQGPFGGAQSTLNTSNVPQLQSGQALLDMMNQSREAAYKQNTAFLDPQFANQEQALRSQLTNQGIPQNSEAWNKAMDDFGRQKEFAYGQARSGAIGQGNAAQNQLFQQGLAGNQNQFGQNLAAGQFGNAAQNQIAQQILQQMGYGTQFGIAQMGNQLGNRSLDEQVNQNNFNNSMGMRNQDINELLLQQQNPLQLLNLLMSGNNVQTPNFTQTPGSNMGNTDVAGIIGQNTAQNNNIYNTQVGNQNSQNAGLASLGAAGLGYAGTAAGSAALGALMMF